MKRLHETYKLYRELPLFEALFSSIEELAESGVLPLELMPNLVHTYDEVVFRLVKACETELTFTGTLKTYRVIPDMQWLLFTNVTIFKSSPKSDVLPTKAKRGRRRLGSKVTKVEKMKIWCIDPINDNSLMVVDSPEISPYCVEVEQRKKAKKRKSLLKSKDKNTGPTCKPSFDPLLHIRELATNSRDYSSLGSKSKLPEADFMAPMPYNEKLRRGGAENSVRIAESQLSRIEVIKGRYRKCAKEYPYRCIDDALKKRTDVNIVGGKEIGRRRYLTLMRGQDRFLAEMAVNAGGTLALAAHNVHVLPSKKSKTDNVREMYGTRRKEKIELASFDTSNSFSLINKQEAIKPRIQSSDSDSSSEDEDRERASSQSHKNSVKRFDFCSSSSLEEDMTMKPISLKKITKPNCKVDEEDVVDKIFDEPITDDAKIDYDDSVKQLIENLEVSLGDHIDYSFNEENLSRNSSLEKKILKEKVRDDFENFTNLNN